MAENRGFDDLTLTECYQNFYSELDEFCISSFVSLILHT